MIRYLVMAIAAVSMIWPVAPPMRAGAAQQQSKSIRLALPGGSGETFDTLEQALEGARAARSRPLPEGPLVIELPRGVLRLSAPIELGVADSGTARNPLVLRGDSMGTTLSGGRPVQLGQAGELGAPLPQDLANPPIFVQAGKLILPDGWPDGAPLPQWSVKSVGDRVVLVPAKPTALAGSRWTLVAGYLRSGFQYDVVPATISGGQLTIRRQDVAGPLAPVVRATVVNAGRDPGPDRYQRIDGGRIRVGPAAARGGLELPSLPHILEMTRVRHVRIENLAFEASLASAAKIVMSDDIHFTDCRIRAVGGWGIEVDGGQRVKVARCLLHDLGGGGIRLNGGDRPTLSAAEHEVSDTVVHHFALLTRTYAPGVALTGVGNVVRNTLIARGPHVGVVLDGNEHRVIGNELAGLVCETGDAGAIYMGRDWSGRGNQITGNYIHDIGEANEALAMGIYLDDQFSGVTIERNFVARVPHGVMIGGGRDNRIRDNVFAQIWRSAIWFDNRGQTWQKAAVGPGGMLRKRLEDSAYRSSLWRARYPALFGLLADEPGAPKGNVASGNVVYGAPLLWTHPIGLNFPQQANQDKIALPSVSIATEYPQLRSQTMKAAGPGPTEAIVRRWAQDVPRVCAKR